MQKKSISTADVRNIIANEVVKGQMFTMVFDRAAAKCVSCGKSSKKWNGLTVCPVCGMPLSYERFTRAQLGVKHPQGCTAPGCGVRKGEDFDTALANGRLKYFDMDVDNGKDEEGNPNPRGGYRQAVIENIKKMCVAGVEYEVVK